MSASKNTPYNKSKFDVAAWCARIAFLVVFGWNVLCALQFIIQPHAYIAAYQLTGVEGEVALRGLGVAFLMWNVTYPLFIVNPRKWPVLGWIILTQQVVGLVGESIILSMLPSIGFAQLGSSILRFIVFDAVGLVLMAVSLFALFGMKKLRA